MLELELLSDMVTIDTNLKPNVVFRYLGNILSDYKLRNLLLDKMQEKILSLNVDIDFIACQQSRGYWFISLADRLKCGFIPLTKSPYTSDTISFEYTKEYSDGKTDTLCIDRKIKPGDNVLIIDDLIATGGTMNAAINLIELAGGNVVGCLSAIEFADLSCSYDKNKYPTLSVLKYNSKSTDSKLDMSLNIVKKELKYFENDIVNYEHVDTIVFSYPTIERIAEKFIGSAILSGKIRKGFIQWESFPDGTPNLRVENTNNLFDKKVIFVMDLSDLSTLFTQLSAIIVIQRKRIKYLDIHIPFFPVGTMERTTTDGEVATAEILSTIISSVCQPDNTKPVIHLYDIHALPNRFYFDQNKCNIVLESAIEMLKREICPLEKICPSTIIVYPDDGAKKRFSDSFKNYKQIVMTKIRNGDSREITINQYINFPKKRDEKYKALIVDDLCQSGGTLLEVISALKTAGYDDISCYVTHGVFPNKSYKKFFNIGLNKFYVTESLYQGHRFKSPFQKIDLIPGYNTRTINVGVTSTNIIKMQAAYYKIYKMLNTSNIKVFGYKVPSNVSEQPVGHYETFKGSLNRVINLKNMIRAKDENMICIKDKNTENLDIIISFENGIGILDDNDSKESYVDFSCCVIYKYQNREYFFPDLSDCSEALQKILYSNNIDNKLKDKVFTSGMVSKYVKIPKEIYDKTIENIKYNNTVADIINEVYGYDKNSWHEFFEPYSTRCELLSCYTYTSKYKIYDENMVEKNVTDNIDEKV